MGFKMYQYCFDFISNNETDEYNDIHRIIQVNMKKASDRDFIMGQFNKYPNLKRIELSALDEKWFKVIEPQHFIKVIDYYFNNLPTNWLEDGF